MAADLDRLLAPPATVGELAGAADVALDQLIDPRRPSTGHVAHGSLAARFAWDVHHEEPVADGGELARRALLSFQLGLGAGRARCEVLLAGRHGEVENVAGRRRYGCFFVDANDDEQFTLEWYATVPDWALRTADPFARRSALLELAERLRTAGDEAALAAALTSVPAASGLATSGLGARELVAAPPLGADEVVAAFGISAPAFAESEGIYLAGWHLRATLGAWTVRAYLDGTPSGPDDPTRSPGPIGRRLLGSGDTVRHLSFG